MASSMKRAFGVPRTLSWMLTPLTMKRLSYDVAPEMTVFPVTELVETPGVRRTAERSVRVIGSFFVSSVLTVVAAVCVCEIDSDVPTTVTSEATAESRISALMTALCEALTLSVLVTVWKEVIVKVMV